MTRNLHAAVVALLVGEFFSASTVFAKDTRSSTVVITSPAFAEVDEFLKQSVTDGEIAGGAVMVLRHGKVVFETGFGFADIASREPFLSTTPCVIASISKPMLGTAIFRLAEAGSLDVTEPISTYLPEYRDRLLESGDRVTRAPTTVELLTHTSGLRNDSMTGGRPWYASWTEGQPLSFVVAEYAANFPSRAQPGTRYAYSGIGTDVAARVAEVAAGIPRNEVLVAELSRPLGMTKTFYRDATSIQKIGRMPTRYYRGQDGELHTSKKRPLAPTNTYSSSGGSIISTTHDMAKWLLMIANDGTHDGEPFVTPETIRKMLARSDNGKTTRCGFFVRRADQQGRVLRIGHTGSSGTNCWIDFETDTIGIMLTQTSAKSVKPFRIDLEERITTCVNQLD